MSLWDQLTDDGRDAMVMALIASLGESDVPQHLRAGLVRYFAAGILPGSFLQAVLVNDIGQAEARHAGLGPAHAAYVIGLIHGFLFEHAPFDAWGSREKVLAWTTTPDRLEV